MGFTILVDLFLFLGFKMDLTFQKTIYKTKLQHHITFHTNKMTTYECKFTHIFILLVRNITVVMYLSHINLSLILSISAMWFQHWKGINSNRELWMDGDGYFYLAG